MSRTKTLLLAVLLVLVGVIQAVAQKEGEGRRILFDFKRPDAAKAWRTVNDGVMGGVSEGDVRITKEKTLEFFGSLSLENNGGFASVLRRCQTERRLQRAARRYRHLHRARQIYERNGDLRLEIEARVLGRQSDAAIGYAVGAEPAAVQAYGDIFFHVHDRLNAIDYIVFQVIGVSPSHPPTPVMLMQLSAYFHGPSTIGPWLRYLGSEKEVDLGSPEGRTSAAIELLIRAQSLPMDDPAQRSLVKQLAILLENRWNLARPITAAAAFQETTGKIVRDLELPPFQLPARAYLPGNKAAETLSQLWSAIALAATWGELRAVVGDRLTGILMRLIDCAVYPGDRTSFASAPIVRALAESWTVERLLEISAYELPYTSHLARTPESRGLLAQYLSPARDAEARIVLQLAEHGWLADRDDVLIRECLAGPTSWGKDDRVVD